MGRRVEAKLSFGQFGGFFLDSCVLLPHSLKSRTKSCSDFLRENAGRCLLCSTVRDEALALIERSYSLVVTDFRSELKPFLENQGIKQLTNRDGRTVSRFFSDQKKSLRATAPTRSNVRNEIIGAIENYVAQRLHSMKVGLKISVDNFIASLMTELTVIEHKLKAPFKYWKTVEIKPDDSIVSQIAIRTLIMNSKDVEHLASVVKYQFTENMWVIFVTIDEKHILSKDDILQGIFRLQCSKPEWALDHFRFITKLKAPVEHYREMPSYSNTQKEFGQKIEKVIGKKILS